MSGNSLQYITKALADYARCIDDDRLEDWPGLFHGPCLYKITTASNYRDGLEAGIVFANTRGMLTDRVSALREANIYERQSYRHILGLPSILSEEGAIVKSETPFMVARILQDGDTSIYATGRYFDVYEIANDTAQLRERTVVCDSSRIDTLLALPL
ncbi:terephthalate 1,2-dioxygenase beta subunit [Bradyrhizobium sp. R2.2-H]|jgi:anthranilate 1,2-dioxygenase small subunit|uniref:aromatic-ring-hydroxylating dioxygenase subunit beta n=1 Tax=unclassified Bradyrhizobium TaxID=2631580 RepID=UPI0010430C87|nr:MULTISPECIES: aromatic-ring-hydroxylating dioxygenase subunit beta [unclassified Bradyrhizobium]TCU63954.1 terephthalate 1,2-dioxygenase beta subunit [Bradyrhizobium sp. Y-H1]TCU65957.1 terephthalate 1,2-dioxygenase beta subunit [Bradyrhizobium sp. R2.2-H]